MIGCLDDGRFSSKAGSESWMTDGLVDRRLATAQ